MADDCQSKPKTAVLPACPAFFLAKTVEDVRTKVRPDPLPCIAHDDFDMRIDAFQPDLHASASRRELDCVGEKVPNNLLQSFGVARHRTGIRIHDGLNMHSLGVGGVSDRADRRFNY